MQLSSQGQKPLSAAIGASFLYGIIALYALAISPRVSHAGSITLVPELQLKITADQVSVNGRLINRGDSPAANVRFEWMDLDRMTRVTKPGALVAPGASVAVRESFRWTRTQPFRVGSHGFFYRLAYEDPAGYAFSAVQWVRWTQGYEPASSARMLPLEPSVGRAVELPLSGGSEARARFVFENTSPESIQWEALRCLVPVEIRCEVTLPLGAVSAGEKREIDVKFWNAGGLIHSSYAVVLEASGLRGATQFTESNTFFIKIIPEKKLPLREGLIIGFLLSLVLFSLWKWKRS